MNQLATQSNSKIATLSSVDFTADKIQLLKNTVCKGSSDNEFQLFLHACQRTGLDPFMRQIYAVKRPERQKDGSYKEMMTIQTGIDGYRLIAERTGKYAPGKEPSFQYVQDGKLISATAYVKKQTMDGTWHEVSATAFYEEYVQTTKDGKPTRFWERMRHNQLAKCAEALALRKAFPGEFSGIYTTEEMQQADNTLEVKSNEIEEDLSTQELEIALKFWEDKVNKEDFIQYMKEMMQTRQWNHKKCLEMFSKKPSFTIQQFNLWMEKK